MKKLISLLLILCFISTFLRAQDPNDIKLKDYRPHSIFNVPVTQVNSAKYKVIDMHSHDYATSKDDIVRWVKTMDSCNIEKTIILTMSTGARFDSLYAMYSQYPGRFDVWCGFDYTGYDKPGFGPKAVKELERCHKVGAKGVGELGDKGMGELYSKPVPGKGLHIDDPRMKPLLEKCAELHMPINIHVAEPVWMYEKPDSTNDGLMNGYIWKVDTTQAGIIGFNALISSLENAVKNNPKTTFIACHFANLMHDLDRLGVLLDKYPNLYADIAARYAETAPIPRYMKAFYNRYQNKLLYGTDMGMDSDMYHTTFRILESADEHFYYIDLFNYHWSLQGINLDNQVLKKLYRDNALKVLSYNNK